MSSEKELEEFRNSRLKAEYYDLIGARVLVAPKCGYERDEKYRGRTYTIIALDVETTKRTGIPTYKLNRIKDARFYIFELVIVGTKNAGFPE